MKWFILAAKNQDSYVHWELGRDKKIAIRKLIQVLLNKLNQQDFWLLIKRM